MLKVGRLATMVIFQFNGTGCRLLLYPPRFGLSCGVPCHDIIPTRAALIVRQHVGTDPYCEFCRLAMETGSHAFLNVLSSCSYGRILLSLSDLMSWLLILQLVFVGFEITWIGLPSSWLW